ncbi:MAG: MFS transporter, partial [Acidobacteria bacterium]|nr:MFS transporter [Acidobacteriota bacterium]
MKLLGWTSLFTDAAIEAIYPFLPVFVTRVLGGTALSLRLIEGATEAIASVLKIVSGRVSDRSVIPALRQAADARSTPAWHRR